MSLDVYLPQGVTVHPDAREHLTTDSALLYADDIGPLGSDRGHDAFFDFFDWRKNNPTASLGGCMIWTCDGWGPHYDESLALTQTIEDQLVQEETGDFDVHQDVYTLDETIIASALAQFLSEGKLDNDARSVIAIALARQAHPLILSRMFGDGGAAAERRRALDEASRLLGVPIGGQDVERPSSGALGSRIRGIRVYSPHMPSQGGPPTDPEVMVTEILDGGDRPGGIRVPRACAGIYAIVGAFFWKLWEAEFRLPGFEEIFFLPTSKLPHGSFEVEALDRFGFSRSVRVGVDPARLRQIGRGEATREGIDLFGGAIAALTIHFKLDVATVEKVRAELHAHGLEFEVLLLSKLFEGFELRAYLGRYENEKWELIAEHRDAQGARRGVALVDGHPMAVAADLKLVKGVVQIVPRSRAVGPAIKFPLKKMDRTP